MGKLLRFPNPEAEARVQMMYEAEGDEPATDTRLNSDAFLNALMLSNSVVADVESNKVRKIIVFEYTEHGWSFQYCNIENPTEIINALGPLWVPAFDAARRGVQFKDE